MEIIKLLTLLLTAYLAPSTGEIASKFPLYPAFTYEEPSINKVTFTQKGYIQFLKYIVEVPTIKDFTACIWLNSYNLTYVHPLVSYSKDEKERLLRVWLNSKGRDLNMAIMEHEVFKVSLHLYENHWNHICSSWNSKRATWQVFLNGKLRETGTAPKLKDITIPGGGDIVVGQEYTDFDKGLDDGVEGDVFGFNMLLASTLPAKRETAPTPDFVHRRQIYVPYANLDPRTPTYQVREDTKPHEVPDVLGYFKASPVRQARGLSDINRSYLQDFYTAFDYNPRLRVNALDYHPQNLPLFIRPQIIRPSFSTKRVYSLNTFPLKGNELEPIVQKPLGLVLVELGYAKCAMGRGSPVNDNKVLVSWTKTPVRVFGGAMLRMIQPFCKKF